MKYNVAGGQTIENVYFSQYVSVVPVSDFVVLSDLTDWIEAIHAFYNNLVDTNVSLGECPVDIVHLEGVYNSDPELNTSKIVIDRNVGTIVPNFAPTQTTDQYATFVTGVGTAKTAIPKVRGRKSWGALSEAIMGEAVMNGTGLARLASMVLAWLVGPPGNPLSYDTGVLSHSEADFVPFNGSGSATNNPGTAIRRRIGRGS